MIRPFLLASVLAFGLALPVMAQDATKDLPRSEPPKQEAPKVEFRKTDNPYLQKAQEKALTIAQSFSEQEVKDLAQIRDAFGIIRSIQVVRRDVENAVKMCGEKNADMKDGMKGRFETWKTSIDDALKPQEKKMKTVIKDGRFKNPGEVQAFLDLLDNAANYAEKKMEKTVVTTPEACGSLLQSLDRSEEVIVKNLGDLKFPSDLPKDQVTPAAAEGDSKGKAAP